MKAIKFNSVEVGDLLQIRFYSPDELVKRLGFDPDNPGMIKTAADVSQQYWQLLMEGGQVMVTGLCASESDDDDDDDDAECYECGEYGNDCECDGVTQLGGAYDGFIFIDPYSKAEFYCYPEIVKDIKLVAKSQKSKFWIRAEEEIFLFNCMASMDIEVFDTCGRDEDELQYIIDGHGCSDYEFTFTREQAIELYERIGIWLNGVKGDPSISPGKK